MCAGHTDLSHFIDERNISDFFIALTLTLSDGVVVVQIIFKKVQFVIEHEGIRLFTVFRDGVTGEIGLPALFEFVHGLIIELTKVLP